MAAIAVETSGRLGSVAVGRGPRVLAAGSFSTLQRHGVDLLPTVDRRCREAGVGPAEIGVVYASGGPGSFTGVRIGLTFAKALAMARGIRTVRVPSLQVIAQNALQIEPRPARVAVILDAKRGNVYCAHFELDGEHYVPLDEPAEREPGAYLRGLGPIGVLGDGVNQHRAAVASAPQAQVLPPELYAGRAEVVYALGRSLAELGRFSSLDELVPVYIRRPEAEEKWDARHGQAG
jgi:tRNA threonylcarbamoyladenosine biosynthesis protein TsaB